MIKALLTSILLIGCLTALHADDTASKKAQTTSKAKKTAPKKAKLSKEELEKQIKAQMELEKKYAREQTFYKGKDYNLSEKQVDPKILKNVPKIEPDYDFDITDVYRDDI